MMDVDEVVDLLDKHEQRYNSPTQSTRMNNGDPKLTPTSTKITPTQAS
jgi:hypothetical protein